MYSYLLLVCGLITNIFPPIGRQYSKIINFPMLGKQEIISEVLSKNMVGITLNGVINLNGTAKYYNNEMQDLIVLSYNLRKTLKMLQVEFDKPQYDNEKDSVLFRLKIRPIFYSKNIVLDRINECK